jgi:hypothetical protein
MIKQFEGKRNIDDKWLVGKSSLEMKLTNAPSFNLIVCKKDRPKFSPAHFRQK